MTEINGMSVLARDAFIDTEKPKGQMDLNIDVWTSFKGKLNAIDKKEISMSDLLALLAQIIESSQKLRAQVMENRISQANATMELAMSIADKKAFDEKVKFGITLAASVATMALTTAGTVKMGQTKTLKDKHVLDLTDGRSATVSSLDSKTMNELTGQLRDKSLSKYRAFGQMSESGRVMVGNVNDIQHAEQVKTQEEAQATKSNKEKLDTMLDQYLQDLVKEAVKLNELSGAITQAALAVNR